MSFFFRNFLLLLPALGTLTQDSHTAVSPPSRNPLPQRRAGKPSAYSRPKDGLREDRCLDLGHLMIPAAPSPAYHRDLAALCPLSSSPGPPEPARKAKGPPALAPRPPASHRGPRSFPSVGLEPHQVPGLGRPSSSDCIRTTPTPTFHGERTLEATLFIYL